MLVVGLDPGIANLGYTLCHVEKSSVAPLALGVFQTSKADRTDDLRWRLEQLLASIRRLCFTDGKGQLQATPQAQAIVCEINSVVRQSGHVDNHLRTVAALSGAIVAFAFVYKIKLVRLAAQAVRAAVIPKSERQVAKGDKAAIKGSIETALRGRYCGVPIVDRFGSKDSDVPAGLANHAFDALALVTAAVLKGSINE